MVNDSHSPVPQVDEKNKQYTACDVKMYGHARRFRYITIQPVKKILHAVNNNILQNLPILQEYFGVY